MTEQEWLTSTDPVAMLRLATGRVSLCCGCVWCDNGDDTVSMADGQKCCRLCDNATPAAGYRQISNDRKLRLFAVACCREVWHLLTDERSRTAVEVAERFADGLTSEDERLAAEWEAAVASGMSMSSPDWLAHASCGVSNASEAAREVSRVHTLQYPDQHEARRIQAALLRDICGNPFRPVQYDRCWGLQNQGAVIAIASVIYNYRRFEDMPILADALEDAQCTDQDILQHCRGQERCFVPHHKHDWRKMRGQHIRGCHVLDVIIGKE